MSDLGVYNSLCSLVFHYPHNWPIKYAHSATSISMTIPGSRRTITLKQAIIVEEEVDVIVNAANDRLNHAHGVAAAINKVSRNMVQAGSTSLMQQHGRPLETS